VRDRPRNGIERYARRMENATEPRLGDIVGAGRTPSQVLYGSQHTGYTPPSPHAAHEVTLGGEGVHHRAPQERPRSLAEQIDEMISKHR
jgi:hypothetical protein